MVVLTLAICGACGIVAPLIQMLNVALYLYIVLLLCGLGANVMSATTVDLYPTRLKWVSWLTHFFMLHFYVFGKRVNLARIDACLLGKGNAHLFDLSLISSSLELNIK